MLLISHKIKFTIDSGRIIPNTRHLPDAYCGFRKKSYLIELVQKPFTRLAVRFTNDTTLFEIYVIYLSERSYLYDYIVFGGRLLLLIINDFKG